MQGNIVESLIGAVVLAVAGFFLSYVYTSTAGKNSINGYEVAAIFSSVDGLAVGGDVRLSGIKIGTITAMDLNPEFFNARLRLNIREEIKLPDDSSAKVTSEGLLGGNYVSIDPGGSENNLAPGGVISRTQGSVNVMDLFAQAIFSATGTGNAKAKPEGGQAPETGPRTPLTPGPSQSLAPALTPVP